MKHSAERVLLLHGLYMGSAIMRPLGLRLVRQGFVAHYFAYRSLRDDVSCHVARLAETVIELSSGNRPVHLLGHSLGGLLVRAFAATHPDLLRGRCVTLGTPHQGSGVAHRLRRCAPYLLGAAYRQALDGQVAPWPSGCEWGNVAGSLNRGIGRLLGSESALDEGDGTVALAETRLPDCHHHVVLPVSHTAMLFDAEVARQTAYFLRHGHFDVAPFQVVA